MIAVNKPHVNWYLPIIDKMESQKGRDFFLLSGAWAFDHEKLDLTGSIHDLVKYRVHKWVFGRGGSSMVRLCSGNLQYYLGMA